MNTLVAERVCVSCGKSFTRRVWANGELQKEAEFAKARFCSRECRLNPPRLSNNFVHILNGCSIIVLNNFDVTLVDTAYVPFLKDFYWTKHSQGYAATKLHNRTVLLHRLILETDSVEIPIYADVDHINEDKLDNRRINLRLLTRSANLAHAGPSVRNTSGVRGVCWDKATSKWQAAASVNGRYTFLGRYDDIAEAGAAYKEFTERRITEGTLG